MNKKIKFIRYKMIFYIGCLKERWMAFCFNVSHYAKHRRRPVKISPEMFARFKRFADKNHKKQ